MSETKTKCFLLHKKEGVGWVNHLGETVSPYPDTAPVGAMWYERYDSPEGKPPDFGSPEWKGLALEERIKGHLHVRTPGGVWNIDGCATGGNSGWHRVGSAPEITARPSINIVGSWHGWLTNGELIPC